MALAANALLTLQAAKDYLNLTGSADDAKIEEDVNRASDWIEGWCHRPFVEVVYAGLRIEGPSQGRLLFVAHAPIKTSAPITVTVNGTAQTVWRTETDGDPDTFDVQVVRSVEYSPLVPDALYRGGGWRASGTPYNVLLSYTGGFASGAVPDDLREACCLCVQKIFRERQRQLAELATVTLPGGGVTLFDRALPARAESLLSRYRRWALA